MCPYGFCSLQAQVHYVIITDRKKESNNPIHLYLIFNFNRLKKNASRF